jgi:hypothetical protein
MPQVIKSLSLGLVLCFIAAQAVSLVDCCCGSFCQHKNACTGCPPGEACPGGERKSDKSSCCGQEESAPKKTCSHLEPSYEIDTVSSDVVHDLPVVTLAFVPLDFLPILCCEDLAVPADTGPPRAAPSRPLHLTCSVLRI